MAILPTARGPFANESESNAFRAVSKYLADSKSDWYVFTNVLTSVSLSAPPDEIDMIVIGPVGLRVIEVKHWQKRYLSDKEHIAKHEADKLNEKIKRLLGKVHVDLRRRLGYVSGRFLLTAESTPIKTERPQISGSDFYTLAEIPALLGSVDQTILLPNEVKILADVLRPTNVMPDRTGLIRLSDFRDLKLIEATQDKFHQIFKCVRNQSNDKLILHLFDLSVRDTPQKLEVLASREVNALKKLHEQGRWVPQIADSYQYVPNYDGEMRFYTLFDSSAPSLKERMRDAEWSREQKLNFAIEACNGLSALHAIGSPDGSFVHRNITPDTLLVQHNNWPLFSGFGLARIAGAVTISPIHRDNSKTGPWIAPEVAAQGIAAADQRSDLFALCEILKMLFAVGDAAIVLLTMGTAHDANERASLNVVINGLKGCQAKIAKRESEIPAVQYWSEGITLTFQGHQYRVVSELGRGSFGASYKVVESRRDGQDGASYVGKVAFDKEAATQMMAAYQSARPVISGDHLATLYQFTEEWSSHNFIALLKYVDGSSINEWRGVIELLADEAGTPALALVQDWIGQALDGLNNLHSSGYIHGDVSPRNIIVNNRNELVLTDYDLVTRVDGRLYSAGTTIYSAPENVRGQPAQCSHDIYALAASIFEVVFDRDPFMRDGTRDKARGLYWDTIDRSAWGWLPEFIDRATAVAPQDRFVDAKDVLDWILAQSLPAPVVPPAVDQPTVTGELSALVDVDTVETGAPRLAPTSNFSQQEVPWLGELLSTYPASLRGNIETRGLDSPFARQTYVATQLDRQVLQDVKGRKAQLIILCGNAGDGKTAFLQNLAKALGLPERSSAERIWDATLTDGLRVMFNLDGAASYNGQSADSLVDELLKPFLNGRARDERAHFLAINNGRLLEWIENNGQNTPLAKYLESILLNDSIEDDVVFSQFSHVRYIDLNQRSLVGDVNDETGEIDSHFLEELLDSLIGGDRVDEIWTPCQVCVAARRCGANQSMQLLRQKNDTRRQRMVGQLIHALQTVHQRGQVHITTRDLRAALTYIFFGIHFCGDIHEDQGLGLTPYWERAFNPEQPKRQGPLLDELLKLDPALDSHPVLDRYFTSQYVDDPINSPPHYANLALESARRRAYFEWLPHEISQIADDSDALPLFQGEHMQELALLKTLDEVARQTLCQKLCMGIAQLENLPRAVLTRLKAGVVPIKILPRTPVETVLWVEKPLARFSIEVERPTAAQYVDWLHNKIILKYQYSDERFERLELNSVLFSLLLDLADGYRLMGDASRDVFANLAIFTQRLAEETENELYAWEPASSRNLYRIAVQHESGSQKLVISAVEVSNG